MPARLPAALVLAALLAAGSPSPLLAQDGGGGDRKERPKDGGKEGGKGGDRGGKGAQDGKKDPPKRLAEGDEVKDLELALAAGGTWTAAAARGKPVVLVFAADWSSESLDALKALGNPKGKTALSGASLLGVLRDVDAEKARKAAGDRGITVPLAVDPRRRAYDLLARGGLPWTVVLDRTGKIVLSTAGFDDEAVARRIEDLAKK